MTRQSLKNGTVRLVLSWDRWLVTRHCLSWKRADLAVVAAAVVAVADSAAVVEVVDEVSLKISSNTLKNLKSKFYTIKGGFGGRGGGGRGGGFGGGRGGGFGGRGGGGRGGGFGGGRGGGGFGGGRGGGFGGGGGGNKKIKFDEWRQDWKF